MRHHWLLLGLVAWSLVACSPRTPPPQDEDVAEPLRFVRDGFLLPEASVNFAAVGNAWSNTIPQKGVRYGSDLFLPRQGEAGDRVFVKHMGRIRAGRFPLNPSPWTLQTIPLENVNKTALEGNLADSCVAIAGTTVAVGTFTGKLHVADVLTAGQPTSVNLATGGMVKSLAFPPEPRDRAFPPDGTYEPITLYAGEQSPRGRFVALDLDTMQERWHFDISEDLGVGKLPGPNEPYGIYSLPGVWQIEARRKMVLFVGVHARINPDGSKTNQSRLYAYTPEGKRLWAWPPESPVDVNILRFAVARNTIVLATSRSFEASTDPDSPWLDRAVYVLDRASGVERGHLQIPPIDNFADAAFIWQSVGIAEDGTIGAIGLSDGRGILLDLPQDAKGAVTIRQTLELGTPIPSGEVSLTAPVAYALCRGEMAYFHTAGSNIPPGAASSATTPPAPHPGANTLVAVNTSTSEMAWSYKSAAGFNGLFSDTLGRWLVTTTGNPLYPDQQAGFGILVFDTHREGTGADRIAWQQPLEGAPFFNSAISRDGFFIAVTETPLANSDGVSVKGTYQTHVLH